MAAMHPSTAPSGSVNTQSTPQRACTEVRTAPHLASAACSAASRLALSALISRRRGTRRTHVPALNVKAGVDVLLPSSETRQSRKTKCLAALAAAAAADGRRTWLQLLRGQNASPSLRDVCCLDSMPLQAALKAPGEQFGADGLRGVQRAARLRHMVMRVKHLEYAAGE